MKTIYNILLNAYEELLDQVLDLDTADDMYDLAIEYKGIEGETVRFSWLDRNRRLYEEEKK